MNSSTTTSDVARLLTSVDRCDVRMTERRQQPRLALETREPVSVGGERLRQHLDRDGAPERVILGAIPDTHAARADAGTKLVVPDPATD